MARQNPTQPNGSDFIDDGASFTEAATAAGREYARSKPWQGTIEERQAKLATFHAAICAAYGIECKLVFHNMTTDTMRPSDGAYGRNPATIHLAGKLSVVTYLHYLAVARGMRGGQCVRFRLNYFKKFFPRSFASARMDGVFLVR